MSANVVICYYHLSLSRYVGLASTVSAEFLTPLLSFQLLLICSPPGVLNDLPKVPVSKKQKQQKNEIPASSQTFSCPNLLQPFIALGIQCIKSSMVWPRIYQSSLQFLAVLNKWIISPNIVALSPICLNSVNVEKVRVHDRMQSQCQRSLIFLFLPVFSCIMFAELCSCLLSLSLLDFCFGVVSFNFWLQLSRFISKSIFSFPLTLQWNIVFINGVLGYFPRCFHFDQNHDCLSSQILFF